MSKTYEQRTHNQWQWPEIRLHEPMTMTKGELLVLFGTLNFCVFQCIFLYYFALYFTLGLYHYYFLNFIWHSADLNGCLSAHAIQARRKKQKDLQVKYYDLRNTKEKKVDVSINKDSPSQHVNITGAECSDSTRHYGSHSESYEESFADSIG